MEGGGKIQLPEWQRKYLRSLAPPHSSDVVIDSVYGNNAIGTLEREFSEKAK